MSFETEFKERVSSIFERARIVGLSLTEACRQADIARATPDRWLKIPPNSVKLVDRLDAVVIDAEKKAAAEAAKEI
jgi:hypothetical protein